MQTDTGYHSGFLQIRRGRLRDSKKEADAASLQAALDKIDHELLRPDRP